MGQDDRLQFLNRVEVPAAKPVVYWMQASARTTSNHALEYAIHLANHRRQPLAIVFALTPGYPGARWRHYHFLLEGLDDTARALERRGLTLAVYLGDPAEIAIAAARNASTLVVDRGYTRVQREWRQRLTQEARCPVVQVESNVVVPVDSASDREEYSAATLRRKILPLRDDFIQPVPRVPYEGPRAPEVIAAGAAGADIRPVNVGELLANDELLRRTLGVDGSVPPVPGITGGETAAGARLDAFLAGGLVGYDERRNPPDLDATSRLSPYLHFGQISPVEIAVRAVDAVELGSLPREGLDAFLEELIVRRELAINFVLHNDAYDRFDSLHSWAVTTLRDHAADERPVTYDLARLEEAETDDPYWNACQNEMRLRGRIHGYMRMYWGKKLLEWHRDPEEAYANAVRLNDKWELDGRDPNGYAGVAWCFGKHDRPWAERPIFGKVRYMNANGLRRKFKGIDAYVARWTGSSGVGAANHANP